jgi:hypothetical protein
MFVFITMKGGAKMLLAIYQQVNDLERRLGDLHQADFYAAVVIRQKNQPGCKLIY